MSIQKLKTYFSKADIVLKLIYVNTGVFLLFWLINSLGILFNMGDVSPFVNEHLAVSEEPAVLLLNPWSLITYQFLHAGLFHIFWNMYILYVFGRIALDLLKPSNLLCLYLLSGISGAVFFVLAYNTFPLFSNESGHMVGASAAVMGVLAATATYFPNIEMPLLLFGRVRLKWIALGILVLSSLNITGSNAGGSFSHWGGALFGFWVAQQLKKGYNPLQRMVDFFTALKSWFYKPKQSSVKVHYRSKKRQEESTKKAPSVDSQEKLDAILDKISKSGYDSLTKSEKDFLFSIKED
mgnify:CR=1 FL=1